MEGSPRGDSPAGRGGGGWMSVVPASQRAGGKRIPFASFPGPPSSARGIAFDLIVVTGGPGGQEEEGRTLLLVSCPELS